MQAKPFYQNLLTFSETSTVAVALDLVTASHGAFLFLLDALTVLMSGSQHTHSWSKEFQKRRHAFEQRMEGDPVFEEEEEEESQR